MSGARTAAVCIVVLAIACAGLAALPVSTPVIREVSPATPEPSPTPQRLAIHGRDFQERLQLTITTPEGGTVVLKEQAIQGRTDTLFQVVTALITPGQYSLVVTNPDGGISEAFPLAVRRQPRPPAPIIERVLPEMIVRRAEPHLLRVQGRHFGQGLRPFVTDPAGNEVIGTEVRDLTATTFTLVIALEMAGSYSLVITDATGATSNAAAIVVRDRVRRAHGPGQLVRQ